MHVLGDRILHRFWYGKLQPEKNVIFPTAPQFVLKFNKDTLRIFGLNTSDGRITLLLDVISDYLNVCDHNPQRYRSTEGQTNVQTIFVYATSASASRGKM